MNYYNQTTDSVLKALETSRENGLRQEQVDENRIKYGANAIEEEKKQSVISVFLG